MHDLRAALVLPLRTRILKESETPQKAGIAQLVEQLICNQKVAGSIPAAGTKYQSKAVQ